MQSLSETGSLPELLPEDPGQTFDSVHGTRAPSWDGSDASALPTLEYRPDSTPGTAPNTPTRLAGGDFEKLRQIGRGGFGDVWEAVQRSLNRTVALKHLRRGSSSEREQSELHRAFRYEALTTAALDHPNIVPVYEYASDDAGNPQLAMKLIRGETWDHAIRRDRSELAFADFLSKHLAILVDVTQAVVFAHDIGIVHRDLKPAQVMLGRYGEVLLADWGLALLSNPLDEGSAANVWHREEVAMNARVASSPAGTPAYMAPEQTLPHALEVGHWTDVYLLGGILYFILTGNRPHEAATAALAFQMARDSEVPHPATLGLRHPIPDDLCALAMRALARRPADRVGSAREFLAALNEHSSGAAKRRESLALSAQVHAQSDPLPTDYSRLTDLLNTLERARLLWPENAEAARLREVLLGAQTRTAIREGDLLLARVTAERMLAGPERERLQLEIAGALRARAVRERERTAFRFATAVLALVLAVGGVVFVSRVKAERRTAEAARDQAQTARDQAQTARDQAQLARDNAKAARVRAERLLGFMIGDLRERLEPIGRVEVLRAVANEAREYFDSIPAAQLDQEAIHQKVATLYQLASVDHATGNTRQGLFGIGDALSQVGDPATTSTMTTQQLALIGQGEALRGSMYAAMGEIDLSNRHLLEARAIWRHLMSAQPGEPRWLLEYSNAGRALAVNQAVRGEPDAALDFLDELIASFEGRTQGRSATPAELKELARVHSTMAETLFGALRRDSALDHAKASIALSETVLGINPSDQEERFRMGVSTLTAGVSIQDKELSREWTTRGFEIIREVAKTDWSNLIWRSQFAFATARMGELAKSDSDFDSAIEWLQLATAEFEQIMALDVSSVYIRVDYAWVCNWLGSTYIKSKRFEEAVSVFKKGSDALLTIAEKDPSVKTNQAIVHTASKGLIEAGADFAGRGDQAKMLEAYGIAKLNLQRLMNLNPDDTTLKKSVLTTFFMTAFALQEQGKFTESRVMLDAASSLCNDPILSSQGGGPQLDADCAAVQLLFGTLLAREGDIEGAIDRSRIAYEGYLRGATRKDSEPSIWVAVSSQAYRMSILQCELNRLDEARASILLGKQAERNWPEVPVARMGSHYTLVQGGREYAEGRVLMLDGRMQEARQHFERCVEVLQPLVDAEFRRAYEIYCTALLRLDRKEEAKPIYDQLVERGIASPLLVELYEETP